MTNNPIETIQALEAQNKALREVVSAFLDCPYGVDQATVPRAGMESAPPYQVVVNMSCSYTKIQNAHKALQPTQQRKDILKGGE